MVTTLDLTLNDMKLIYEALDIADAWYKASGKFAAMKKYFDSIIKSLTEAK